LNGGKTVAVPMSWLQLPADGVIVLLLTRGIYGSRSMCLEIIVLRWRNDSCVNFEQRLAKRIRLVDNANVHLPDIPRVKCSPMGWACW